MPTPPEFVTARSQIAGIPVVELARQFGTPAFVYDAAMILQRLADLAAFDVVRYAQKACSNLAILDLLRRHGALVDAVSAGEIRRAMAAGYAARRATPPPIVYTADIFDAESLDLVLAENIHVNCGSPDMIDQFGSRAPGREITLRINPGFGHGHSQKTNTGGDAPKHGIWHEQLADCLVRGRSLRPERHRAAHAHRLGHRPGAPGPGLRGHGAGGLQVGRNLSVDQRRRRAADPLPPDQSYVDLDRLLRPLGRHAQAAGGPLRPSACAWRSSRAATSWPRAATWWRRSAPSSGRATTSFYLLDAGFNNLARPILYGAYHPMSIVPRWTAICARPEHEVIVGGPLCESGDIFTQEEGGFVAKRPPARWPRSAICW